MGFLLGLIPAPSRAMVEAALAAVVVFAIVMGCAWFAHHERQIGRAEIQAKWNAERAQLREQVQQQQDRNRELQREAEKRYTVQGEIRDRFIVQTITEVRHETDNLAACVLRPAAVRLLNDASRCASEDRPAACGAGQPVQPAAATP